MSETLDIAKVWLSVHGDPPQDTMVPSVLRVYDKNGKDITDVICATRVSISREALDAYAEVEVTIQRRGGGRSSNIRIESPGNSRETQVFVNGVNLSYDLLLNSVALKADCDMLELTVRFDAIILSEQPEVPVSAATADLNSLTTL